MLHVFILLFFTFSWLNIQFFIAILLKVIFFTAILLKVIFFTAILLKASRGKIQNYSYFLSINEEVLRNLFKFIFGITWYLLILTF